ncbi:LysR family transcriptional regulator [Sphingorhabdus lutea]|uniref:LysR family transcriptional regulator n=1 Tax=Sphingorhabdus lutea TaxID=1913578 RepID=A0A1L3JAP8_9SPHN|nr:hydrogen peroxide-inducible genes activator [Sphingorhabdus lutea]APG62202.1 LysR family transcriptional regulator [Sphingorhabdus lutea]
MSSYYPSIKQLQYLVALEEFGHFGKAAEASFVTQSTLSAGIKELETLLGIILVERTKRTVRFTPLGQKVVKKAHEILREAEALTDLVQAEGKPLAGELRMSVIPTIAPFLLPKLLPQLRENYPELKLFLREETSSDACNALSHGQVDCVLLALPYNIGAVHSEFLFDDALHIAFAHGQDNNPPAVITPEIIDESTLLLLVDGHCLKDHALSACNRPEISASAMMMGTSLHTLVQMVDNDLGTTLLPQMAISSGLLNGTNVRARPLDAKNALRKIALIWRHNSPRHDEFLLLAQAIKKLPR